MKKRNKALLILACAGCLIVGSVFGTFAYLTDQEAVENTFTVGSVGLKLSETEVNSDGTKKSDTRVQSNHYELLPGRTYIKDPTVTVDKGSVESYIRIAVEVKCVDQLKKALSDSKYYADLDKDGSADDFVLELLLDNSWNYNEWHFADYTENSTSGIYEFRYYTKVDASKADKDISLEPLFTRINVPGEIDNAHLDYLKDVEINVVAHAIQAPGFDNADAAWAAFDVQHSN